MTWFKYYKDISSVNYSTPPVKRFIKKFTPKDTLQKGTWLFVDITGLNINKKLSSDLQYIDDEDSYIVVYEDPKNADDYTPVKTVIINNRIYFQTAEDHQSNIATNKNYSIYYMAPGIRFLQKTEVNGLTKYYLTTQQNSITYSAADEVSDFLYRVSLSSSSYYNISFINSNLNWNKGVTNVANSKAYIILSGPYFELEYFKSSDGGRFLLEFEPLDRNYQVSLARKKYIIDSYSIDNEPTLSKFIVQDLSQIDYRVTLTVLNEGNSKSANNFVRINGYSFVYNFYGYIEKEILRDDVSTIQIGASSAVSAVIGSSSGDTIVNNTYQSVSERDMKIRYWMEVM